MTLVPQVITEFFNPTGSTVQAPAVGMVGIVTTAPATSVNVPAPNTPGSDVYGIAVPTPVPNLLTMQPAAQPAPVGATAPNLAAGVVQQLENLCGCTTPAELNPPAGLSTAGLTNSIVPAPSVGVTNLSWLWLVLALLVLWAVFK